MGKCLDHRNELVAERLDAVRGIRRALVNPLEALFLLRKPAIDALEPLEDFGAHLLQPQHALLTCHGHADAKLPENGRSVRALLQELSAASCRR